MGLLSDLFGGGHEDAKSYGNSNIYIDRQVYDNLQASNFEVSSVEDINNLLSVASGSVTRGTEEGSAALANLLTNLPRYLNKNFTKDAAIADSQGAVDAVVADILNKGLPDVRTAETIAGGYDSTTRQLLADNVFAQAAREGAKLQLDTINDYAAQGTNLVNSIVGLINTAQNENIQTEETQDTSETASSTETTSTQESANKSSIENTDTFSDEYSVGRVPTGAGPLSLAFDAIGSLLK